MDSWKCQTSTVTPAEPGDFPFLFNRFDRGELPVAVEDFGAGTAQA